MYQVISEHRRRKAERGFTLIELLVVMVVLAVLAAILLPKFVDSGKRGKEAALKHDLKLLRGAINLFQMDTGAFPSALADLAATSAPSAGKTPGGQPMSINANTWHGPYLQSIPKDPVSMTGANFTYYPTGVNTGQVVSSTTGYTTW